jgi:8-oxo-dGTP diphosphatase
MAHIAGVDMVKVEFHDQVPENTDMPFVIIASRYKGKWIFVRHRERSTYELPAGHIEPGEDIFSAAGRELYEETGAAEFSLSFMTIYTATVDEITAGGYLFYAEIHRMGELPDFEIAETALFDRLPDNLTYPAIQPLLFDYVLKHI